MRIVLSVLAFCFLATMASAQIRAIANDAEAHQWRAVGVITINRRPVCTATLIAPDLVLTAAHCVYAGRPALLPPELVEFRAGWRDGQSVARRRAARITAHRSYDPRRGYNKKNVAVDIAVIELDIPIPASDVAPMALLNRLRRREKVDLVSYGQGRMDHPSIHEGCQLLDRTGDVLRLTCAIVPGTSGAPVFGRVQGKPQIVSLISGAVTFRNGHQVALGVAFDKALAKLMNDRTVLSSMTLGSLPFWDTGRRAPPGRIAPPPVRRVVRPGGSLNLPQN